MIKTDTLDSDPTNNRAKNLRALWQHSGELHYSRDVGGVHYSVLRTLEVTDVAIHLPEAQIDWLCADLSQSALPSVVLMHHPASEMRLDGNRRESGLRRSNSGDDAQQIVVRMRAPRM